MRLLPDDELRLLIVGGETLTIEFKGEEKGLLSEAALVEAVVCMANGQGGHVLVGVEDDGRITGARPRHGTYTDVYRLEALFTRQTVPPCPVRCAVQSLDGHDILIVEVPSGLTITSTASGSFKQRRRGADGRPACLPLHFHEMQSRQSAFQRLDPSAQLVPGATVADLDPLEIERIRQMIQANVGRADTNLLLLSDIDLLKALGLVEGNEQVTAVTLAGLLLVGRAGSLRRLVPTHEVAFQVFDGTRLVTNELTTWPLVRWSQELLTRFDARNQEQEMLVGMIRVGIPDYSRAGFREAVHNSLVHRDYGRLGSVHVQWHSDHLDISNPGGFVEGVSISNLLVTAPKPRNQTLADAFKRIGLVERSGRGVDTIYEGQLRYGRPAPDYSLSNETTVQVSLMGGPANLNLARWIIEQDQPNRPITVEAMLLVNAIERERLIDTATAATLLQRPESWARALLERLVERGLLEPRGTNRNRAYGFTAAVYRVMGKPAGHVRSAGMDALRREHMVFQYATQYGRITRKEVAALCGLSDPEAKALLQVLVRKGHLKLVGTRRVAYYVIPLAD